MPISPSSNGTANGLPICISESVGALIQVVGSSEMVLLFNTYVIKNALNTIR